MFVGFNTPDGKPRLLKFPAGVDRYYNRGTRAHRAIRVSEQFPQDWQLAAW